MAKTPAKKTPSEPTLYARLRDHFGRAPVDIPVLQQRFASYERPNLQLALDEMLPVAKRRGDEWQVEPRRRTSSKCLRFVRFHTPS